MATSVALLFSRCLFALSPVLMSTLPLHAQSASPTSAEALSKARLLYYTPVDKGLESFHCEIQFDWKDFMQKATNQQIPDTDDRLKYLRGVGLSIDDVLRGAGELHWQAPAPPPDGTEDSVGKIRDGMRQMWSGFFQSWNSFLTGDLTSVDLKSTVEHTAEGFHVTAHEPSGSAEEQYDNNLLLKSVRVSTPTLDSTITPTFSPGPHGLLLTTIRSTYRQPPSAPTTEVLMQLHYAPVGNFELPSDLEVAVGPARFAFRLVNCTVKIR